MFGNYIDSLLAQHSYLLYMGVAELKYGKDKQQIEKYYKDLKETKIAIKKMLKYYNSFIKEILSEEID